MIIINGDQWAAAFLASEPDYDEPAWIDAYAMALGRCNADLAPEAASRAARDAYGRNAWLNPKVAAGMDAVFGTLPPA